MKISLMSYTFSRQPNFDFARMCRFGQELGIDGVDVVTLHGLPVDEIRRHLQAHQMKAVCYTFPGSMFSKPDEESQKTGSAEVRQAMQVARALGADKTMLVTPGVSGISREITRQNYIKGLREAVKIANDAGITLTIENFPGKFSPFVTANDILQAIEAAPGLKLTFDNGNAFTGEDPVHSFELCANHIVHSHFKDWTETPRDEGMEMLNSKWYRGALIGEGEVNQKSCLQAMQKAHYSGYINIEYEGNTYSPEDATRKATHFIRQQMYV